MDPPKYEDIAGDFSIISPIESGFSNFTLTDAISTIDPPPYSENISRSNMTITSNNYHRVQFQVNNNAFQSENNTTTRTTRATPLIRTQSRQQHSNEGKLFPDPLCTLSMLFSFSMIKRNL